MSDDRLSNMKSAERNSAYYDNVWKTFPSSVSERMIPNTFGHARFQFIINSLEMISSNQSLRILDLGCGDGWIEQIISKYGDVTAVDFAPETINSAQKKYGEHANFKLANSDYLHLGLGEDTKFDIVLSTEVIEHVQDHTAFMRQINSFLKPNGWCILTTPNRNVWDAYKDDERHNTNLQPIENWLSPIGLRRLFKENNFKIKSHLGWTSKYYPYNYYSEKIAESSLKDFLLRINMERVWMKLTLPFGVVQLVLAKKIK